MVLVGPVAHAPANVQEVEMQNQVSSLAAVPLYQAITDFWMARAALPSTTAEQPAPRSNSPTKHVEAGAEADKVGPLQMQCA